MEEIDDDAIPVRDSATPIRLRPYKQDCVGALKLQDWYGPLDPGFYVLELGYSFRRGGPNLTSD